ncbi:MAG TPA: GGDEF domain-containing phosphodiesterase [Steroidobacteraceae bacterium]|nr:GGDEF domain-containing phosphodiesterase [Steroidobacteraceae bacterium]
MTRSASLQSTGTASPLPPAPAALDEALRRVQDKLDAAFVAIHVNGGITRSLLRDIPGARVLEDLWRHGADGLLEQVRTAPDGKIGTNRLRGERNGPVCGKLVGVALRDTSGTMHGILVAIRTVDQPKFGPEESQQAFELAGEIGKLFGSPAKTLLSWSGFEVTARNQESTDGGIPGCILYGDLDQLHVLNKLAGLTAGDQAIAAVGVALQEEPLPEGAGVCHISGDRFAVYLPKTSLSQGRRMAEQLCRTVSERCAVIGGLRTRLSISFGVASIPPADNQLTQALAAAEAACRAAKDRGRGRVELYQDSDLSIVRRNDDVLVASRLRKALETERIGIVAQPIVPLTGESPTQYFELLVRLVSETGTFVSPQHFMSAALRYQLLIDLDRTVLTRVFERLRAAYKERPDRAVRFSLNLSGPSIGNPDFLEWLSASIGPASVPGEWLQFEITETAAVANVSQTQTLIRHLRARGAEFALDDFGTGVSSLAYLKAFDVSMLKLDGSFTRDLLTDARSESLIRGLAQLSRAMGIQTVAECVETEVARQKLTELGVDRAQGFLFGQPVPLESILSEHPRPASPPSATPSSPNAPAALPETPEPAEAPGS